MGLPLSEVREVRCPVCGALPGWACVRVDANNGGGEKRERVHQSRVQAAGRKQSPEELTECRQMRVVLAEAMEAVLEGHPEKPIKLATNPVRDLYVRAAYLLDSVAPEMSTWAAAFISGPAAAAATVRRATVSPKVASAEPAQRAPVESAPIGFRYGVVSVPVF